MTYDDRELRTDDMKDLFSAVARLKSAREAKFFLRDLCTIAELKEMAARWQVAQGVTRGTPYREIAKKTGASTATITRVAYWLHHGMGGYELMLERFGKTRREMHRRPAVT